MPGSGKIPFNVEVKATFNWFTRQMQKIRTWPRVRQCVRYYDLLDEIHAPGVNGGELLRQFHASDFRHHHVRQQMNRPGNTRGPMRAPTTCRYRVSSSSRRA